MLSVLWTLLLWGFTFSISRQYFYNPQTFLIQGCPTASLSAPPLSHQTSVCVFSVHSPVYPSSLLQSPESPLTGTHFRDFNTSCCTHFSRVCHIYKQSQHQKQLMPWPLSHRSCVLTPRHTPPCYATLMCPPCRNSGITLSIGFPHCLSSNHPWANTAHCSLHALKSASYVYP